MQGSEPTATAENRAILTVALCCMVAAMEGIDLQAPGLTVPVLAPLFAMSAAAKGWFLSASTFGLILGAAIGGRLSDRIGRKWVLIIAAALFGLFSIATALSTSAQMLMAMRFATGLGLGGALPNVVALAAESVSFERRHTAVGILYAGLPAGGGLASLIVALVSGPSQWPLIYLVGGIAPLVLVPLLALVLPNRKPLPRAPGAASAGVVVQALFGEGRAARTLLLWLGFFSALLILYLLLGWLPTLMGVRGLTRPQASTVQIAFNWAGALGSVGAGLVLDRGRRGWTTAVVFALTGAALAYLAAAPAAFWPSVLAGALVGSTITGGAMAVLYSLAPNCYPTAVRGTGVGAAVAAGRLGSAVGPLLAGALIGAGHSSSQVLTALLPIIAVSAVAAVLVAVMAPKTAAAGG